MVLKSLASIGNLIYDGCAKIAGAGRIPWFSCQDCDSTQRRDNQLQ